MATAASVLIAVSALSAIMCTKDKRCDSVIIVAIIRLYDNVLRMDCMTAGNSDRSTGGTQGTEPREIANSIFSSVLVFSSIASQRSIQPSSYSKLGAVVVSVALHRRS